MFAFLLKIQYAQFNQLRMSVCVHIFACAPNKFPVLKKMLAEWHTEDIRNMPVKSFLLEEHIEEFCLECIYFHSQSQHFTFEVQLFLMHALFLRLQSGTNARHKNLVEIKWSDTEKLEPIVGLDTPPGFSVKVKPGKVEGFQRVC